MYTGKINKFCTLISYLNDFFQIVKLLGNSYRYTEEKSKLIFYINFYPSDSRLSML